MLLIDQHEPSEAESLLAPVAGDVLRTSLNTAGQADYVWSDADGNIRQVERKQIGEVLGDMDGVEEQLNRELETCKELTLLVEGVWMPTDSGVQTYRPSKDNRYFIQGWHFPKHGKRPGYADAYLRWIWSLMHVVGIEVVQTPCFQVSMHYVAGAFLQSLKDTHTTMQRYVREHIPPFSPNPHIDNLCRIKGARIGVHTAERLIERYNTFWGVVSAPLWSLRTHWGKKSADNFAKLIGRED